MDLITLHWGTICPINVLSSKFSIVPGGGGYRFPLRGDLLIRPFKGRQSIFAAVFRCIPSAFDNDCSMF